MASSKGTKGATSSKGATVEIKELPSTAIAIIAGAAEGTTEGAQDATTETPSTPERASLTILAISGARKEGKETIIHSNLWGKERWFAKKRLHSYSNLGDGQYLLILPTTELGYRDAELTEPLAKTETFAGFADLPTGTLPKGFHKGGAFETLNVGF